MYPYFYVFGREIPVYGVLSVFGMGLAIGLTVLLARKYRLPPEDGFYMMLFAAVGGIVGAKLLYAVTLLPWAVRNISHFGWDWLGTLFGGYVYYGGFAGGIFGVWAYCRAFKLNMWPFGNAIMPGIPLFHAVGRVGCFFGGCCYGCKTDAWYGITLASRPELGALVPVQLLEAAFNLALCAALLLYSRPPRRGTSSVAAYLTVYGTGRFLLEFLRGDAIRGFLGELSTSQVISIVCFAAGLVLFLFGGRIEARRERKLAEYAENRMPRGDCR